MVALTERSMAPLGWHDREPPEMRHGAPVWDRVEGPWRIRFVGRGGEWRPGRSLGPNHPSAAELAWAEQRHTAEIADARPGSCGVADALAVERAGLAALVVTADCVPIALVRGERAVLVHAGWRGIAGELPKRAAAELSRADDGLEAVAWIGPAIGPCCYEVGEEVAAAIVTTAGPACVARRGGGRPRLDLRAAAAAQLRRAGIARIAVIDHCTRCRGEWLWSYRRDGEAAGRNLTLLWRETGPPDLSASPPAR